MEVQGEIVVITGSTLDPYTSRAISTLGEQSAKAQGLTTAITIVGKLQSSGDRVYLFRQSSDQSFIAFLRVGKRKLFLYDADTKLHEMQPLCCLDIYVSESRQRRGIGYQLFNEMLRQESISSPAQLAFDKPSSKLLCFLSKNFRLDRPIAQTNNFVVFLEFFPATPGGPKVAKLLQQCQPNRRVKTHYDSSGIASLLSSDCGESKSRILSGVTSTCQRENPVSEKKADLSTMPDTVSDVLRNAQYYKQEDIEALRLSEESLSQIDKKIEEREATIARIEKELQTLELTNNDLHLGRPGKDGFSKSELIRKIHSMKQS